MVGNSVANLNNYFIKLVSYLYFVVKKIIGYLYDRISLINIITNRNKYITCYRQEHKDKTQSNTVYSVAERSASLGGRGFDPARCKYLYGLPIVVLG